MRDVNSDRATEAAASGGANLLSTLAFAEVAAVLARLQREGHLSPVLAGAARSVIEGGPWRRLTLQPDWAVIDEIAGGWPVRGADLWHLATAVTLRRQLPELQLITFDSRMAAAADGLGLAFESVG